MFNLFRKRIKLSPDPDYRDRRYRSLPGERVARIKAWVADMERELAR